MAVYESGKISRNKIITTCNELFYINGYKKTTYKEICEKAESNPGLISYYFKTKKNIAMIIHGNLYVNLKLEVEKYLMDKFGTYDLQIGTSLEHLVLANLIDKDSKLRQYYYDICIEGVEYDMKIFNYFFKLHVDKYHLPFTEDEIKLITTANTSISIGIVKKYIEGYLHISKDELFKFRTRIMYNSMGISSERIEEIINETFNIYSEMKIELANYFLIKIC